jgi:hypothetical protein
MKINIFIILFVVVLSTKSFSQVMADCTDVLDNCNLGTFLTSANYNKQTDKIELKGKVIDLYDSTAIPSANIVCLGSNVGAVSDIDGEYTLTFNLSQIDSLNIAFIGFNSESFSVRDKLVELFRLHKHSFKE